MTPTLAGWLTLSGSSGPPRLPWDSGLLGCARLRLGAWVEWAHPRQAHLLCSRSLWSWLAGALGIPQRDSWVGSLPGQSVHGPSTFVLARGSLFTKAWTNSSGPMCRSCSCSRENRSQEKEKGMSTGRPAWAHRPSHGGPHSPVPGCHRAQHHPEDVSPSLPLPRGCCFSRRPGQRLHRECFSSKLGHRNDLLPSG